MTLTILKTCSAVAYKQDELTRKATAAFTRTKPAATYHLVDRLQISVVSVVPVSVTISGTWLYTFSQAYEQSLAEKIAGDNPEKAKASLLKTGVISYASIPGPLPPAMYITFVVVVG